MAQYNLDAYCFNNPFNMTDEDGKWPSWATKIAIGVSVVSNRIITGSWEGSGKAALDRTVNGFADGFMAGGVMAGGSQVLSGGFKLAANAGIKTTATGGNNRIRIIWRF